MKTSNTVIMAAIILLALLLAPGCAPQGRRAGEIPVPRDGRAAEPAWRVVGSYSTRFDLENQERSHNIRLAASRLDGAVIPAGERWSFNQEVGPRELAGGWELAPALDIEGANPSAGGGICQVSSTTYNALLLGDLQILTRFPHSRPIHYIPLGRDATVSFGDKDLLATNPHPFPVRLGARVVHDRLVVQVLAPQPLGYEVRLQTADVEPASLRKELQILENPDRLAVGGVWVKLDRLRLRGGSVFERERIGRPSYYPYRVPPAEHGEEAGR